jgi:hypothetical protein
MSMSEQRKIGGGLVEQEFIEPHPIDAFTTPRGR